MADSKRILSSAKETLSTAKLGLDELDNIRPDRRMAGLRNFVSFARSVTFVLQNLRSATVGFDEWYEPYVKEMSSTPLFKYFVDLRNEILKTGETKTEVLTRTTHFNTDEIMLLPKPPLPVKSFFMGDRNGGDGWVVLLPDGTEEKYYINLQSNNIKTTIYFKELPNIPELHNKSIKDLCTLYYNYLETMVKDAFKHFG